MKIDFHCHTKKTKSDEADSRNLTPELFKEKIILSGVKIVAITNHNLFDIEQYYKLKETVKEYCQVWPGIELDVIGKSQTVGHLILISNPADVEEFSDKMNEILKEYTPDSFNIKIDELYQKVKSLNLIYVVHCFKKKELPLSDIEEFEKIMDNPKRLFKEPSSLTSITVLQSNKHRVIVGTDVIDWSKYESYNFGEFKFELNDFSSFIKIIEKDRTFLKDLVDEELNENIKVYGKYDTHEYPFVIPIYNDVNIIFGDRGSGKSEILKSLNEYYKIEKNEDPVFYVGGDQENWFKNLIKVKDEDFSIENFDSLDEMRDEIKLIANFIDTTPIKIKKYVDYFQNSKHKASKERMKCLVISKQHLFNSDNYNNIYNEYKKIYNFYKDYKLLKIKSVLSIEEQEKLGSLLLKLIEESYKEVLKEWINQWSEYLCDDFAGNIPIYVSENVGEPSPPTETGFATFAKNRLKLKKTAYDILDVLKNKSNKKENYIGSLGSKGKVMLSIDYSFINADNKETIDAKTLNNNKTDLKSFITNLQKIMLFCISGNVTEDIIKIKQLYDKGIDSINDFISVKKEFQIDKKGYTPSKGENSILALQHELLSKKGKNIFLIDEPDLSLGHTYINDVIVPLFKDIAKSHKILVVATHDANIAVRTRPLNSILKITDNNCYKTYVGNMFSDILQNIENENDELSWKEQSVKYLEGGEAAFSERGDLYE